MLRKCFKRLFSRQYKKTESNGHVSDFSIDYNAISVDNVLETHKYLIKKMIQYKIFGFVKKIDRWNNVSNK